MQLAKLFTKPPQLTANCVIKSTQAEHCTVKVSSDQHSVAKKDVNAQNVQPNCGTVQMQMSFVDVCV